MCVLPDHELRRLGPTLVVDGYDQKAVQPASYEAHLGETLLLPNLTGSRYPFDLSRPPANLYTAQHIHAGGYSLKPGDCVLGTTRERFRIPADLAGRVEGCSSIGRCFVRPHDTAGYLDPGFEGQVTLEIVNSSRWTWLLKPGMRICQIAFERMASPVEKPYGHPDNGNHYQGQRGPTAPTRAS